MSLGATELLGTAATLYGVGGALSVLLQARQMYARSSSGDVSARFLAVYVGGFAIWLLYGLSIGDLPIIVVHAVGLLCGAITLAVALRLRSALSRSATNQLSAGIGRQPRPESHPEQGHRSRGRTSDARETVEGISSHYAEGGIGRCCLHLHPEARPPELRDLVAQEDFTRYRGWVNFHRDATPPPDLKSELRVRHIGAEHAVDFGRIVAERFDLTEAMAPLLASLVDRPGWRLYMNFAGDESAGTGALFIRDGVAWLDWAATLPAYRGRGRQGWCCVGVFGTRWRSAAKRS